MSRAAARSCSPSTIETTSPLPSNLHVSAMCLAAIQGSLPPPPPPFPSWITSTKPAPIAGTGAGKDFYAVLGIPKDADEAAVKKAYRFGPCAKLAVCHAYRAASYAPHPRLLGVILSFWALQVGLRRRSRQVRTPLASMLVSHAETDPSAPLAGSWRSSIIRIRIQTSRRLRRRSSSRSAAAADRALQPPSSS